MRDVSIPAGSLPLVVRGPGFFLVDPKAGGDGGGDVDPNAPISIAFDGGGDDSIPVGVEHWSVSANPAPPPGAIDAIYEGSARFILVHGGSSELGAYDIVTRTLRSLGPPPPPVPMQEPHLRFHTPPSYVYDDLQERVWFCGSATSTVSLLTGETRTLPFGCIDMHHERGGELLLQAPDGTVYALAADGGEVTSLGTFPPYGIRYARGRAFLYVRSADEESDMTFSGWVGDTNVVRTGMSPHFSADGQRLYWLEDVALDAGDLLSFDLATRSVHRLVRNVSQFDELPDGRLMAIANAAIDGPFNRAVVVDERAGETYWLAPGVQTVGQVGDAVIVGRAQRWGVELYRLPVPPPNTK
jgi:hypothetical protein